MADRRTAARPARCQGDEGSALMLMPAAVLIMVVLSAIAADLSYIHMAKRDLVAMANSIANDAVTYGVDRDQLRNSDGKTYPLVKDRVEQRVRDALVTFNRTDRQVTADAPQIDVADRRVTITLRTKVEHIFGQALPGTDDAMAIDATGTAVAEEN